MPHLEWSLPDIDLEPFLRSSSAGETSSSYRRLEIVNQLRTACGSYGIFSLINHGVSTEPILQAMDHFFALEDQFKSCIASIHQQGFTRGYIPVFGESGLKDYKELKEAFSYGYPWDSSTLPQNALQGPNVWPPIEILGAEWRHILLDFYDQMVKAAKAICAALSLALEMEEDFLGSLCEGGETISLMRAFHYLPSSDLASRGIDDPSIAIGSSPHTDWGFLTLIVQDGVKGLQVREREDLLTQQSPRQGEDVTVISPLSTRWMDVPASKGSLVVNCGDFLSLLSSTILTQNENRKNEAGGSPNTPRAPFHSPIHRVLLSPQPRTSMVFFFYPNFDTPLPQLSPSPSYEGKERSSNTISKVGKGEGKEERAKKEEEVRKESYNTLMDLSSTAPMEEKGEGVSGREKEGKGGEIGTSTSPSSMSYSFGEHLLRKWAGVKST